MDNEKHFEPVTAKSLAKRFYERAIAIYHSGVSFDVGMETLSEIIEPHIRKPSDEDPKPTLQPFSLEEAAKGAKVVTRNGMEAKIVADDLYGHFPILAITNVDGVKYDKKYMVNGRLHETIDCTDDLFILKEPEVLEIQVWQDKNDKSYLFTLPNTSTHSKYYEADCELIKTIITTIP